VANLIFCLSKYFKSDFLESKYIGATPDGETNSVGNFAYQSESSLKFYLKSKNKQRHAA
jgi:hypothetical protein